MNIKQLTTGTDLEVMLRHCKTKELVSAIDFVKENKDQPRNLGEGFAVLHDNVLLEFNVPPSDSKKAFIQNLREGIKRIKNIIGKNHEMVAQASHIFDSKYLKHKDA